MTQELSTEVRTRYFETDQMGMVHHSSFFVWFEIGRTEYLRASGATYRDLEKDDLFMPVLESYCRHLKPARYDDVLQIGTRCERVKRVRLRFDYSVRRPADDALLAEGYTVHVATDAGGALRRLPQDLLARIFPEAVS